MLYNIRIRDKKTNKTIVCYSGFMYTIEYSVHPDADVFMVYSIVQRLVSFRFYMYFCHRIM